MEADLDGDGKISFEEFTKMVENTDVSMSMTLGELPPSFLLFLNYTRTAGIFHKLKNPLEMKLFGLLKTLFPNVVVFTRSVLNLTTSTSKHCIIYSPGGVTCPFSAIIIARFMRDDQNYDRSRRSCQTQSPVRSLPVSHNKPPYIRHLPPPIQLETPLHLRRQAFGALRTNVQSP